MSEVDGRRQFMDNISLVSNTMGPELSNVPPLLLRPDSQEKEQSVDSTDKQEILRSSVQVPSTQTLH